MPARDELIALEPLIDDRFNKLKLWSLPLRYLLSRLFLISASFYQNPLSNEDNPPRPDHGDGLLSRMSYIAPNFARCPLVEIDERELVNARKLTELQDEIKNLLSYMHFCELMPEIRNEHYIVTKDHSRFVLERTSSSSVAEEIDVLFTELSLASELRKAPKLPKSYYRDLGLFKKIQILDFTSISIQFYQHYMENFTSSPLLPSSAYEEIFGFSDRDLHKVRSALAGLTTMCSATSYALISHGIMKGGNIGDSIAGKGFLWNAPFIPYSDLTTFIKMVTDLNKDVIESILLPFTNYANNGDFSNAGDGFFPPLTRIDEMVVFSPYGLRLAVHERNLLYVMNKKNRTVFNESVSSHLEPLLLTQAKNIVSNVSHFIIKENVCWSNGEIDLLVYDPHSNVAMQIQAKGGLSPDGARMTRQIQSNTLTASSQLRKFQSLTVKEKDKICSDAIHLDVKDVQWISAFLSRSGFGAEAAWREISDAPAINITILKGIIKTMIESKDANLLQFNDIFHSILDDIRGKAVEGWRRATISVFDTQIEIPLLVLDREHIYRARGKLESE